MFTDNEVNNREEFVLHGDIDEGGQVGILKIILIGILKSLSILRMTIPIGMDSN